VIRFGTCVGGSYKSRFPTVGRRCWLNWRRLKAVLGHRRSSVRRK